MTIHAVQINSGDLMGRRFNGFDLRPYLAEQGVESDMLVYWNKESDAPFVSKMFQYPGTRALTRVMTGVERRMSLHARLHPHSWTLPYHKKVRDADLMHLHIIHDGYFSMSALPFVTRRKPTVWTWHDPWAMTGHCIHPFECRRWTSGCGSCPGLDLPFPMRRDRTAEEFAWKKKIFKNTRAEVIVASQWMRDMAVHAPLAENFNFTVIPFGLDLERYRPADKAEARARLGVFPGKTVIFIRASGAAFKGLKEFIQAVEQVAPEVELCIVSVQDTGHFNRFIGRHQLIEFGWSNDEQLLLDAYAACDFFAMPSMAEAFGMMAIEAMACGRPVVSFEGTSLPGTTFAPDAGIAVPRGDAAAFARVIERLARDPAECEARGHQSRLIAVQHYDIRDQARLTADLYRRALAQPGL